MAYHYIHFSLNDNHDYNFCQLSQFNIFKVKNDQNDLPIVPCKTKRQYLLTLQESRYCLLTLQIIIVDNCCKSSLLRWVEPLPAKLFIRNFHSIEVVSRWRDTQLQLSENYSGLTKWVVTILKYFWFMTHFIFNMFKEVVLNKREYKRDRRFAGLSYESSRYWNISCEWQVERIYRISNRLPKQYKHICKLKSPVFISHNPHYRTGWYFSLEYPFHQTVIMRISLYAFHLKWQ